MTQIGKVKSIQKDKGFGFIRDDNGGEYFFHRSGCLDAFDKLTPGKKVEFESVASPKGLRAEGVRLV